MRKKDIPPAPDHRNCLELMAAVRAHPALQEVGRMIRFRKGTYIWRPEDTADRLYWLEQGQVVELRGPSASRMIITRVLQPGESFGHFCFCVPKGGVRGTSARVTVDAAVLELKFLDVIGKLQNDKKLLTEMLFQFCARLADTERRLEILTYRGAADRLGHLLLDLGHSRGTSTDKKGSVLVPVTHDQLAQMTAMSRTHVTVTMGAFRKAGLVRYSRDQPLAIDLSAIREYLSRSGSGAKTGRRQR